MTSSNTLCIDVLLALPDALQTETLVLAPNTTVASALAMSELAKHTELSSPVTAAIFGKLAKPEQILREGDRLELLRPLAGDPKEIRRRRAEQNGHTMVKKRSR